ncbi:hypothetical protein QAD02_009029 [Eretmocerus hayati]|uniref:Uncharacterized protein n=1 Tax=Eretmocerus hayati TaxID=131215 RepID=A0ACC2N888_9HYME|nr:hypothetical protein QAD02_009029 [Eretmocerus hayati]
MRSVELYFPAREGRGLGCLLPQLSNHGLSALESMLVYDPENRACTAKLLEHRYFADFRGREVPRQTRSTVSTSNISRDRSQRQNPMVLNYLSSERNCRLRLLNACQSEIRRNGTEKNGGGAARMVESTPNANRDQMQKRQCVPAQIDGLEGIRRTQLGRYFLRRRARPHDQQQRLKETKYQQLPPQLRDDYSENTINKKQTCKRHCNIGKCHCRRDEVMANPSDLRSTKKFRQADYLNENFKAKMHQREERHSW